MTRVRLAALELSFVCNVQGTRGFVVGPSGGILFGRLVDGYVRFGLKSDDGGTVYIAGHQLVLKTCEPIYDAAERGLTVDHFDRDRANNTLDNLRRQTKSYQTLNRDVPGVAVRKVRASHDCALRAQAEAGCCLRWLTLCACAARSRSSCGTRQRLGASQRSTATRPPRASSRCTP